MSDLSIELLVAGTGNEFMRAIAGMFEAGFTAARVPARVCVDTVPSSVPGVTSLVVAPHEYFPLFLSKRMDERSVNEACRRLSVINVEQPGSEWFELAWQFAKHCRAVFDISREGAAELQRRGAAAFHAPLGWTPRVDAASITPASSRPIDVLFMGHASRRREEFISRHDELFSRFDCTILMADVSAPRDEHTPGYAAGPSRDQLLGQAKIFLNVHSSDRRYFETHRAVLALTHGCVLVSETSRFVEPLQPGRHFEMAPLDELPRLCAQLLSDPARLNRVADTGRAFFASEMTMSATCRAVADRIASIHERPAQRAGHEVVPNPDLARQQVASRLAAALAARSKGREDWHSITNAAYQNSPTPSVSVAISLYNYAQFLDQCVDSVLRADAVPGGIEIIVVDDASTDESATVAELIASRAEQPVRVVRKDTNTGLADTRNLAIGFARAPFVFILDADNWIYPACLRALKEHLESQGGAAAYSLIRRFDDETGEPLGLLSKYEWNVRSLVRYPYIDAMAMFRKTAMDRVGGYSLELIEYGWFGWEDYDLWLKLAAAGESCQLVPQLLCAYRVHATSMIHRTNRTSERITRHFRTKFGNLVRQYSDLDYCFGFPTGDAAAPHVTGQQTNEELEATCRELEARLSAMYASNSWRVTGPLRMIQRWLTGRP